MTGTTDSALLRLPVADIDKLLQQMTLPQKVALMSGASTWSLPAFDQLGIPALKLCDGPNAARGDAMRGVPAASFPVGAAMASTWNLPLIERLGVALAEEAHSKGVNVLLGPTINLQRHPLGGRNFECYSEDPLLSGALACAFIRGVQSQGVAACAKHFVANDAEVERHSISSEVDERTLRELYLRPFEMAVREADVWTVMSAYNRINGIFASSHEPLLRTVLKDQWGFAGLVVSDWGAALDTVDNANAGLDLEMPGPTRTRGTLLIDAIEAGQVALDRIDDSVRRLLRVIQQTAGLHAPGSLPARVPEQAVDRPEHRALAREVAGAGMVLLRNEAPAEAPLLPLDPGTVRTVAVIGPNADPGQIQGGGSSQVFPHYQISPLAGLRERFATVHYALGATNRKYLPVPTQERTLLPGTETSGLQLKLYANPERRGEPALARALSARVSPWGFIPLGFPGREDSPFAEDDVGFSAELAFDYRPEQSGSYEIALQSAGLTRLYLNDSLLIDNWTEQAAGDAFFGHGSTELRGSAQLWADQPARIRIEFQSQSAKFIQGVRYGIAPLTAAPETLLAEAAALAADADVAVLVIGSNSDWETEGNDRADMALPGAQDALVERVLAANPNTVVVINGGAPLAMPWFDRAPAVLNAWLPGQEFGHALADILTGDRNPSGRLAQTLPVSCEDSPSHRFFQNDDGRLHYGEGLLMGYRGFAAGSVAPLVPFGFGLSYTRFSLSDGHVTVDATSGNATVQITVHNTGPASGRETVQVYLTDLTNAVPQPPLKLAGFSQLALDAGEQGTLTIDIRAREFAYWDSASQQFRIPAGPFELRVGHNVADLPVTLTLTQPARSLPL